MTFPLLSGMATGIAIAAPVGPIALLCLRRTLTDGRLVGFVSGLGAATADTLCGATAAFGLSALVTTVNRFHTPLQAGGGIFMVIFGLRLWRAPAKKTELSPAHARNLRAAFGSTFVLTLANPMTILSFAGVAAALGREVIGDTPWTATQFVAGVFSGSALWWLLWSGAAGWFRRHLGPDGLRWVNRLAGAGLAAFGAAQLARLTWGGGGSGF